MPRLNGSIGLLLLLCPLDQVLAEPHAPEINSSYLAGPEEVTLKGLVREDRIVSSLGRIELRWPRKAELLFGRTPQRAMADAAQTASRALKRGGFLPAVQNLDLEWKVVFMDEDVPEKEIPYYLVTNCHPAWMTPPANLYVVAQRVAAGCGGAASSTNAHVADATLAQILLHEIGHAVEFSMLGRRAQMDNDRARAEGFASWFEQYAADLSSVIPAGKASDYYLQLARSSFAQNGAAKTFAGGADDYARASMVFRAIVSRKGVRGLSEVYETMTQAGLPFPAALERRHGWDAKKLSQEIARVLNS